MHVYAINTLQTFVMYVKAFRKEKLYRTPPPPPPYIIMLKNNPKHLFLLLFQLIKENL